MTATVVDYTAANGAAWPAPFVTNVLTGATSAIDILDNSGRVFVDGGGSAYDAYAQIWFDTALWTDLEIYLTFVHTGDALQFFVGRMEWTDPGGGYIVQIDADDIDIHKVTDTAPWTPGASQSNATIALSSGTEYGLRVRIEGTTISARIWATSGAEPGTWDVTYTDATYAQGNVTLNFDTPTGANQTFIVSAFEIDDLITGASYTYVAAVGQFARRRWPRRGPSGPMMRVVPTTRGPSVSPATRTRGVATATVSVSSGGGGGGGGGWLNLAPASPPTGLTAWSVPGNVIYPGDAYNLDHIETAGIWGNGGNQSVHITNSYIHADGDLIRPHGLGSTWIVEDSYLEWDRPIWPTTHADHVQALLGGGTVIFRRCTFDAGTNQAGSYTTWGYDLSSRINHEDWSGELLFEDCLFTGDAGFHHWETNGGVIRLVRCKFDLSGLSSNPFDAGISGGGSVVMTDCVFGDGSPIPNQTLS